jgi:hypothetical protein
MENGITQGLAGRARRVFHRSRADRLFAQQSIDEYFEPDPCEVRHDRFIPISRRNDFLPSVTCSILGEETEKHTQLELPLTSDGDNGRNADQTPSLAVTRGDPTANAAIRFDPQAAAQKRRDSGDNAAGETGPACAAVMERGSFSLRGFLFGCALGSSAAAVLLLVLSAMF